MRPRIPVDFHITATPHRVFFRQHVPAGTRPRRPARAGEGYPSMSDEVLVKVEGVSKKFCRSLKRSLWYGVQDVASEMFGREGHHDELRKNEFWAAQDVSFELKRGECLGLIGPNGAGKSTLLKMLNGLVKPDKGRITIRGRIGALIELGAGFNPILTGRENIYINGSVLGFTKKEIDRKFDAIVDFAEIEEFIDTPVQNYSSGMKVRLGFAVAAQMEPDVLLIDEVLAVGDLGFRTKCMNSVLDLLRGTAVVFVTHRVSEVSRICTGTLVLLNGNTEYMGPEVPRGISTYFGLFSTPKGRIIGGKTVRLVNISINNLSRNSHIRLFRSNHMTIVLTLELGTPIEKPNVSLMFLNEDTTPVAQCSSFLNGVELPGNHKELSLSVDLGEVEFNPGRYSIEVAVTSDNRGTVHLKEQNAILFEVAGDHVGYAPIQLAGRWTIQ